MRNLLDQPRRSSFEAATDLQIGEVDGLDRGADQAGH